MVNHNCTADVGVAEGSASMSGHGGLHALGRFCDVLGLGELLCGAYGPIGEREPVHDRGKALVQALLVFAGGGEACSDIEVLRCEGALFGSVPSASTLYRVARGVDAERLGALRAAAAHARQRVWPQIAATRGEVVIDIDASLVEVHSENKEGTAAHYKGGFGFHPMYAFADCTGECLAVQLRPGNAAANSITDQTAVLDASIEALPTDAACGHRLGDDASQARRRVRVRADSAGCNGFIAACVERNVGYSVVARRTPEVEAAIATAVTQPALWQPAEPQPRPNNQRGQSHRRRQSRRRGARAADLTRFVDREHRPEPDARLIMRREPLHQGAQRSLFPSDDWRYWGHWTNLEGSPAARDADMRAHARVEDHIARLKDSGGKRFPFCDLAANAAWHQLAALADTVVRWFQQTCLTGALKHARPKTLRWNLWHTPARLVRHARASTLILPANRAATAAILNARIRIDLLI